MPHSRYALTLASLATLAQATSYGVYNDHTIPDKYDLKKLVVQTHFECQEFCDSATECVAYTYVEGSSRSCTLKKEATCVDLMPAGVVTAFKGDCYPALDSFKCYNNQGFSHYSANLHVVKSIGTAESNTMDGCRISCQHNDDCGGFKAVATEEGYSCEFLDNKATPTSLDYSDNYISSGLKGDCNTCSLKEITEDTGLSCSILKHHFRRSFSKRVEIGGSSNFVTGFAKRAGAASAVFNVGKRAGVASLSVNARSYPRSIYTKRQVTVDPMAMDETCEEGLTFCPADQLCADLQNEFDNCGTCGNVCESMEGAKYEGCDNGKCVAMACEPEYFLEDGECLMRNLFRRKYHSFH